MARAVMRLFDGVQLAFGPTVDNGFYYDFDLEQPLSEEDFPRIEAEMAKIVKLDEPFERLEEPRDEALADLPGPGPDAQGRAHRRRAWPTSRRSRSTARASSSTSAAARTCPAPAPSARSSCCRSPAPTGKATPRASSCSGSTAPPCSASRNWTTTCSRSKRPSAATTACWASSSNCSPSIRRVGSGLILWLPKGAIIRRELENFLYGELIRRGYQPVYTPHIGKVDLYETSGHYPYYADSQFPPIEMDDDERYLLKPMNCPHHIMIYKSKPRSYRDLPLRLAEFGTVYRFEQSGELNGMTRVRGFTQDDAHIFCTEEQVADEFRGCIEMTQFVLQDAGPERLPRAAGLPRSRRATSTSAAPETWDRAEAALEAVCRDMDLPNLDIERGEAAFYGPKADFVVTDCIGREWQLGTVQLDYNLPSPSGSAWNTSAPTTSRTSR